MYHPFLIGDKIYLRGIERKDINGNWFNWFNDPEITNYLTSGDRPNSYEALESYYEKIQASDTDFLFAVVYKENDEHVGNCGLHQYDPTTRQAKFGLVIGEKDYHNKGLGKEAVELLLQFGFERLNLNRIHLKVHADNKVAIKLYEKCGFKKEGTLRDDMYKNAKYFDALIMSILRKDYDNR